MKLHYPHTIRIDDAAEKKPRFNENRDVVGIYFWPFKHHFVLIWHHACAAVFSVGFRIFQNLFFISKFQHFLKPKNMKREIATGEKVLYLNDQHYTDCPV